MPEERNQPLADGFYFLFFGILQIQAKSNQVLNHPKDLSFISAGPARPGSFYFFQEGAYLKMVLKKGREGLSFDIELCHIICMNG
jgi:hypothetical protein